MKVIVVSPGPSSFVLRDVDILREMGHTVNHVVASKPRDLLPLAYGRIRSRLRTRFSMDIPVIFWFAGWTSGWWSLLPPAIARPFAVIVGGGEVMVGTRLGGSLFNPSAARWIRMSLDRCDAAVFVAEHLLTTAARGGIPLPRRVFVSPTAVDDSKYVPGRKERQTAVLLGPIPSPERAWGKGLDRLAALATANPKWHFDVVGVTTEIAAPFRLPDNVNLHTFTPEEGIVRMLGTRDVILCLSRLEGMPNALIEGMMSGCIPVVSDDVSSLPWAVGDTGLVLHDDFAADMSGIKRPRTRVRNRAIEIFSMDNRRRMWATLLAALVPG